MVIPAKAQTEPNPNQFITRLKSIVVFIEFSVLPIFLYIFFVFLNMFRIFSSARMNKTTTKV